MGIVILLLAFLLEGLFTMIIPSNWYFFPLFTSLTLFLSVPFFKDNRFYLGTCLGLGLLYDLFTNTIFLYTLLFLFGGILFYSLYPKMSKNLLFYFLSCFLISISFAFCSYALLLFTGYLSFSLPYFIKGMLSSFSLNLFYAFVFSLLFYKRTYYHKSRY